MMQGCDCGFGTCNNDGTCNCWEGFFIVDKKCDQWIGDVYPKGIATFQYISLLSSLAYLLFTLTIFYFMHRHKGKRRVLNTLGILLLIISFFLRTIYNVIAFSKKDLHKYSILYGFLWPTEVAIFYFHVIIWVWACKAVLGRPISPLSQTQIHAIAGAITIWSYLVEIFVRAIPTMLGYQNTIIRALWAGFLTLAALIIIISFWSSHIFIHCRLKALLTNSKAVNVSERKQFRFRLQTKLGIAMTLTLLIGLGFPGLQYVGLPRTPPFYIPVNSVLLIFEITFATQYMIGVIAEIRKEVAGRCWDSKSSDSPKQTNDSNENETNLTRIGRVESNV